MLCILSSETEQIAQGVANTGCVSWVQHFLVQEALAIKMICMGMHNFHDLKIVAKRVAGLCLFTYSLSFPISLYFMKIQDILFIEYILTSKPSQI